jgi:hypothetical protein
VIADLDVRAWSLGPGGSQWWLKFPRPASGVAWVSTCGLRAFVEYQCFTGSSCASLTSHGIVITDQYVSYTCPPGQDFYFRLDQSVGGAPVVALRAASFHA